MTTPTYSSSPTATLGATGSPANPPPSYSVARAVQPGRLFGGDFRNDTLVGFGNTDTVDYSMLREGTSIVASLATGKVNKAFAGIAVDLDVKKGRYIRIYQHFVTVDIKQANQDFWKLGELNVLIKGGLTVGSVSRAYGYDDVRAPGGGFGKPTRAINPYIEFDLGYSYDIDWIVLRALVDAPFAGQLRVYVSDQPLPKSTTAYDTLATAATVARVDVGMAAPTTTDTLSGIRNLVGTSGGDRLTGDDNANSLFGGGGDDTLAGGTGADTLNGGDGNDVIAQDMSLFTDTLIGGAGIDTVDYGVTGLIGIASTGITANLSTGKVAKVFAGTSADVGAAGRYIRIYHTDATQLLTLTGLKVFAGGVDVAAGRPSTIGGDAGSVGGSSYNNPWALTDGAVGGAWNGGTRPSTSNLANVTGSKTYIELDLGSVQAIDSIALWGHTNVAANSNNLRVYVSSQPFPSSATAYALLAADGTVARVDVALVDTAATTTFSDTLSGIENIIGTALADSLTGDGNANTLSGGAGDDTLDGGANNDILSGGAGNDTLAGGAGADSISGDDGNDLIVQDMGKFADVLNGGIGIDTVDYSSGGTSGSIVANLATGKVGKVVAGVTYTDTLSGIENIIGTALADSLTGDVNANTLSGGAGNDTLAGGAGADSISGDDGNDLIMQDMGKFADVLNGGAGIDTVDYSSGGAPAGSIVTNLATGKVGKVVAGVTYTDTLSGIENVTGTALADSLTGDVNANTLSGGAGDDTLAGGAGADSISGGDGNDLIVQDMSKFADALNGGAGIDTVDYSSGGKAGSIFANLASGKVGKVVAGVMYTDTLIGIENIVGTALADNLTGDVNANTLSGGVGSDTLDGGAGNDTLAGGADSDTYLFARGGGADVVQENAATGSNKDVLRFGTSIDASQVWLRKINNDLELSLIGTSDRVTVAGWYTGQSAHVEEIYAGGKKLLDTNVDKLVSAMAGFNPPAAGQTTLPTNLQTALRTVMAANWTAA